MKHEHRICRRARAALDRQHDGGRPPGSRLLSHIDGCPSCREYREYLALLGRELRDAAEARLAAVAMPDLAAVRARAERTETGRTIVFPRLSPRILAAAAALLVVAGAFLGIYSRLQQRHELRLGTELIAERILGGSLFEGVEFAAAQTVDLDGLLDDLGGSRRLFSPLRTDDSLGGSLLGGSLLGGAN